MRSYAGIGSRETPKEVLKLFREVSEDLAKKGITLRSGGADGADKAFEEGCDRGKGLKEIYLPWKNFNGSNSALVVEDPKAYLIAEEFHPNWYRLSEGAKKLQARNSHQVLGKDLDSPTDFVLCWTKEGKGSGGTGQAIRLAEHHHVPIFDAGRFSNLDVLWFEINMFTNSI